MRTTKDLRNINSKLSENIRYEISGYSQQELGNVEIICFDKKIYFPLNLRRRVLYWCQLYINHTSIIRIANTIRQVWYWKGLLLQEDISFNTYNKCQQFKNRKTIYWQLSPKIVAALKPWNLVHIDLIGSYYNSIIQQQTGSAIIKKLSLPTWQLLILTQAGSKLSKSLAVTSMS